MASHLRARADTALRRIALRAQIGPQWAEVTDLLARHARGELSDGMALSRLLVIYRDVELLRRVLVKYAAAHGSPSAHNLVSLLETHRDEAAQTLGAIVDDEPTSSLEEGIERYRRRFDEAVHANAAASVALYSLGDEQRLRAATEEAVGLMTGLGIVAAHRDVLDLGCGIGRFEAALSSRVGSITGIDVSPGMIAAARERCAGLTNVRLLETSGRDLTEFADACFDAAIAVDSVPYIYEVGGPDFVLHQIREIARVLRTGGDLLILNLSYRSDVELDRADATRFAAELGLDLLRNGTPDLRSWDGNTFHLRKSTVS